MGNKILDKRGNLSVRGQIRGQVTIFIIIAVVIVALVLGYLLLRGSLVAQGVPASIQPAYTSFVTCLQEDAETGINVLESQGGYIELPEFVAGSSYMPFSSQLNFAGNPIPYWYYVSGNNIQKEQIPSKDDMEEDLADFVEGRIRNCNLRGYHDEGLVITMQEPDADVDISSSRVKISLNMPVTFEKENDTAVVRNHEVTINSKLGGLYDSAKTVYEEENDKLFLERYGIDVLRLYAPVDGVELTCSPLTWDAEKVFDNLQEAIDANTASLKNKGEAGDYFALNLPVDEDVRFLTSRNWPNSFEVLPADERILIATPAGNQQGLGIIGFCYVPYHFVYNIKYPVLVQVYDGEEIFQFPLAVVIQGNNPRESLNATDATNVVPELCQYKNTEVQVRTYDTSLNPINADISYECFGNTCAIGATEAGTLKEDFPQCVNGYVTAKANGFKNTRYLFSTVQSGTLDMLMDRVYDTNVRLLLDGALYNGNAIITITSDYATETIVYPEQKEISLGEGQHEIHVQIFRNSSITIGATTTQQCIDVPQGILGIFGITHEKCFDIEVPEQIISQALAGGGKQIKYILETDLARGSVLEIHAESLPLPETIEQIQDNYLLFEDKNLEVGFV